MALVRTHQLRTGNPLIYAVGSWIVSGLCLMLGDLSRRQFGSQSIEQHFVIVLIVVTAAAPFGALLQAALAYKRNAVSLFRISRLYGALLLICANINFVLQLHFSRDGSIPFRGMAVPWMLSAGAEPQFSLTNTLLTAIDCLYFSVTSLSTVGFGDITPTAWYARLAVSLEILTGLSITVLTVGRHFSRSQGAIGKEIS